MKLILIVLVGCAENMNCWGEMILLRCQDAPFVLPFYIHRTIVGSKRTKTKNGWLWRFWYWNGFRPRTKWEEEHANPKLKSDSDDGATGSRLFYALSSFVSMTTEVHSHLNNLCCIQSPTSKIDWICDFIVRICSIHFSEAKTIPPKLRSTWNSSSLAQPT